MNQGFLRGGTVHSDSHTLAVEVLGYPRTLVAGGHSVANFDREAFNEDVRRGRMIDTNGPILITCIGVGGDDCVAPSLDVFAPDSQAELHIELRAAPWIPVREIRIIVNGKVVRIISSNAGDSIDPFSARGVLLFQDSIPLAELLAGVTADAWIVVEAGFPLWAAADLIDDDGVLDTTDNNGDGVVDVRDHEGRDEDDDYQDPPSPTQADARFHVNVVAPGTWPTAFTNPFILDREGDGQWSAPGL